MRLEFAKMHGLGNDFVVVDAARHSMPTDPATLRFLANRQIGVGCDQILLVEPAQSADVDFQDVLAIVNGKLEKSTAFSSSSKHQLIVDATQSQPQVWVLPRHARFVNKLFLFKIRRYFILRCKFHISVWLHLTAYARKILCIR